jgi:hypothetical protein
MTHHFGWEPGDPCPCGCGVVSLKFVKPLRSSGQFHLQGCKCRSHIGKRNRAKGQRAQRNAHQRLGGTGMTPSNEESGLAYEVTLLVRPEVKKGEQVSKRLLAALSLAWSRRAFRQSEKAIPEGSGILPAVYVEPDGETDAWIIVRVPRQMRESVTHQP